MTASDRSWSSHTSAPELVLSVFGGAGLLDNAFAEIGFRVVFGPEIMRGIDVRGWSPDMRYDGVIGGSPCQDFSSANRTKPTGAGVSLIREFLRVVVESGANWFVLENVPRVPAVSLDGFRVQRLMLDNRDFGGMQRRLRCFQFGSRSGESLSPVRVTPRSRSHLPTLTGKSRVTVSEAWAAQEWPERPLALGKRRAIQAIANGVPRPLAMAVALAVRDRVTELESCAQCRCGCGSFLPPGTSLARVACRQRVSRVSRFGVRNVVAYP